MSEAIANIDSLSADVQSSMRLYAETTTGVRKIGMLDEDRLAEALQDERTITGVTSEGETVALLTPLEYGDGLGYDVPRCQHDILPADAAKSVFVYLSGGGLLERLSPDSYHQVVERVKQLGDGYVFSSFREHDNPLTSSQAELNKLLADAGLSKRNMPLLEPEAEPDKQEATLSLWGMDVPADAEGRPAIDWDGYFRLYQEGVEAGKYEHDTQNGIALLKGAEVPEETREAMWTLYQDRFQWLGKKHPISMEDTKEDFMATIRNPATLCSIRFKDGQPVCFMDLVGSTEVVSWLKPEFLDGDPAMRRQPNQQFIFFPGLVTGEKGAKHAAEVIALPTRVVFDSNSAYKIVFENTNLSEGYVPRIVYEYIKAAAPESGQVGKPACIDKTFYSCTQFASVG